MSDTAVTTVDQNKLPVTIDAEYLAALGMTQEELAAQQGIMGMENARPEDFQIPRLQIAQAMSPQLLRSKPEYIPNLMVGQYFNTVTGQIYGDSVLVIPIKYSVSRLKFVSSQGIDCSSKNGIDGGKYAAACKDCEFSKWGSGKDGNGTACQEYRNWLVLDKQDGLPMSMSFKSSSLVVAKQWATLLAGRKILVGGVKKDAPAFLTVYELRAVEKQTAKGTFYIPAVRVVGAAPADLVKIAADIHKTFKGEIVNVNEEHEE